MVYKLVQAQVKQAFYIIRHDSILHQIEKEICLFCSCTLSAIMGKKKSLWDPHCCSFFVHSQTIMSTSLSCYGNKHILPKHSSSSFRGVTENGYGDYLGLQNSEYVINEWSAKMKVWTILSEIRSHIPVSLEMAKIRLFED